MAVYHLRNFRLSPQTAWGTPATPATLMMGITDGNVTVSVEDEVIEAIGWNVGNMALFKQRSTTGSWTQIATYEQIIYTLSGLFGVTTPMGTAAPYTWHYRLPAGNAVVPVVYTIDYVMQNVAYRIANCLVSRATIRGEVNSAVEIETEFLSPNAPTVITSSTVSIPATTIIATNAGVVIPFLEPFSTISSIEIHGTLISFEISIDSGRHIKRFIGGTAFFGDTQWSIEGTIRLEVNTTSRALIEEAFQSLTQRMFRILIASGTNGIVLNVPFTLVDDIELYSDRDGNATVEIKFAATHSTAINSAFEIYLTNAISSL